VAEEHYVSFENRTWKDCFLSLDNSRFVNCRFERVSFLYSGGPYRIEGCHLGPDCKLFPQGPALLTASLLEGFRNKGIVAVLYPEPGSPVQ
jgi:hypothetical protein